ncbi:hypothetical protein JOC95_002219 [Bacillus tianshenii]|uniref:Uncharacterized protein n=1 Tax=Sutcliffiella tianshenii TaxID=1463404 RepID=A0ABS2P071_9BACI|nr:hypothetical protein [Bacillus tianshenii]
MNLEFKLIEDKVEFFEALDIKELEKKSTKRSTRTGPSCSAYTPYRIRCMWTVMAGVFIVLLCIFGWLGDSMT